MNGGSQVYMCLYDLQKAFDLVEYQVLLTRVFEAGVKGKTWKLLQSWYDGVPCCVSSGGHLSESFAVERGVEQGSIPSPSLFLMVMDPLLQQLECSGLGLFINYYYAGGFMHADDIRTLATSSSSLNTQVSIVNKFAEANG